MGKGMISAIQKFSLHDGPGIRTVIFFKGCPLDCPWCSNPETQSFSPVIMHNQLACIRCGICFGLYSEDCAASCPTRAMTLRGEWKSVEDLMVEIRKDSSFYRKSGGGVTFSGGEPLMQSEFLLDLAVACKKENIHTAIETTGYAPWKNIESLVDKIDLFLYDLKIINTKRHEELLGVSNEGIHDNLKKLVGLGKDIIIRIPIIPGYTDSIKNLEEIIAFVSSLSIEKVNLLPYHNYGEKKYVQLGKNYELSGIPALKKEDLCDIKEMFEKSGFIVKLGG